MPLSPHVTEVERLLFLSDAVAVGAFRCPSDHPLFVDSGPTSGYVLVFPRSSTTIRFDGGGTVTGGPPTVIFYDRGQAYTRRRIDRVDASDWYMIAPDIVRDAVAQYDPAAADRERRLFPVQAAPATAPLYMTQRTLHSALRNETPIDALDVEESAIAILHEALRAAVTVRASSPRTHCVDAVESAKALIAARPAANPSLRAISSAVNCSPYRLCRSFHALTGVTMTQYRHTLRLRLALGALSETGTDLTDIALDLGYSSHSHFTMAFRRQFGVTPSHYRRAQSNFVQDRRG